MARSRFSAPPGRFLILALAAISALPTATPANDAYWDDRFDALGLDGPVHAIAADGSNVYVGGTFRYAGTLLVNHIARWDGGQWHTLGSGITDANDYVKELLLFDGNLYAGGSFESIGGVAATALARWDGASWNAVGTVPTTVVYALAEHNGCLYAGGYNWLARWDSGTWTKVGELAGRRAITIASDGTNLYVGGDFTSVDGVPARCIARWDGLTWSPLGGGLTGSCSPAVNKLLVTSDGVFTAGSFFNEYGTSNILLQVGVYDAAWNALGSGVDKPATYPCDDAMAFTTEAFDDAVVFGGIWETAGGLGIPYLALWDGTEWKSLGSGVNNMVIELVAHQGRLYVGGNFGYAGGKPSRYFGIYDPSSGATAVAAPPPAGSPRLHPNPFNPDVRIDFELSAAGRVRLDVVNARGFVVRTLLNGFLAAGPHAASWDGRTTAGQPAASGVYAFRLASPAGRAVVKGTLLK